MSRWVEKPLRLLDFDIETRLVGFHKGGKFAPDGCEPVAIACSWMDPDEVFVWQLGVHKPMTMLRNFVRLYQQADAVTGHYIRKFDLPILNGAMLENGLPPLGPKMTSDTKGDLAPLAGVSKSQENLSAMLAVADAKYHMPDARWRAASRLTKDGIAATRKRVVDDVLQHMEMRRLAIELGYLRAPRVWG